MTLDLHVVFEGKAYKSYQTKIPTSSVAMVDPINMQSYGGCVEVPVPCIEPLTTGANVLRDPSFDILPAGTGPNGNEIPVTLSGGGLQWPSEATGDATLITTPETTGWANTSGTGAYWTIAASNPFSGGRHARFAAGPFDSPRPLRVVGFVTCERWSTGRVPMSGRVAPGRNLTLTIRSMVDTGSPTFRLRFNFMMQTSGLFSTGIVDSALFTLTNGYAAYTHQATAPASTYYYWAEVRAGSGFGSKMWDVDHCQLSVI